LSSGGLLVERQLELNGGQLAKAALAPAAVIGVLDPVDDSVEELGPGPPAPAVEELELEGVEEALSDRVVQSVADRVHLVNHLRQNA